MSHNKFVDYLNSLHNEKAGNSNALAEAQQNNPNFQRVRIHRQEADYLAHRLEKGPAFLGILTGHAGDGKTTILFQTLEVLGVQSQQLFSLEKGEITTGSGKKLVYVKDFSELSQNDRSNVMRNALDHIAQGISTLLVANTGPLIETFRNVFSDKQDAESTIIEQMDNPSDFERVIYGYPILTLNIARLDNTNFLIPYGNKLVADENWMTCQGCDKRDICPIFFNVHITKQCPSAFHFLKNFYIWEQEMDKRATIRQITAHLAYAITGGLDCSTVGKKVQKDWKIEYLFSNNLFGGRFGARIPSQIKGIRMLNEAELDTKNTVQDYTLFIQKSAKNLLPGEVIELAHILDHIPSNRYSNAQKQKILKRMLIVFPLTPTLGAEIYRDVFAKNFPEYLEYREGTSRPSQQIKKEIFRALQIIFTGETSNETNNIYVTLRRSGEQIQNVQLLIGRIDKDDLSIDLEKVCCAAATHNEHYDLVLKYEGKGGEVKHRIGMPLLNYFSKIAAGLIISEVDPLLSYGIESLKAKLMSVCKAVNTDSNQISMLIFNGTQWEKKALCFEETKITDV